MDLRELQSVSTRSLGMRGRRQTSADWWIKHNSKSRAQVISDRNPIEIFGMVMARRTPKHTALTLWQSWAAAHPEVIAWTEKAKAEAERKQAEYEAAKEAHIKDVLSCLDRVDWKKAMADDGSVVSSDAHAIGVSIVDMAYLRVDSIDGKHDIEFEGKYACRIDQRPEVEQLSARLTEMWIETQKTRSTRLRSTICRAASSPTRGTRNIRF